MNDPRWALIVRAAAALLSFALSLLLARTLGTAGFGELSVLLAIVNVAVVVALLGQEALAMRNLAAALGPHGDISPAARRYCRLVALRVWQLGAVAAVGAAMFAWWAIGLEVFSASALTLFALIPFVARARLSQSMLRGVHRSAVAIVPDGLLRPLLALLMVAAATWVWPARVGLLTPQLLVAAGALAVLLSIGLERRWVGWHGQSVAIASSDAPQLISRAMFASSLCAVLDSQLPLLVLGVTAIQQDTGLFAAAERLAQPTALVAQTVYVAIAGRLAHLYAQGDVASLRQLVRRSVMGVTVATVLICTGIALAAASLLDLFGATYLPAIPVLYLLLAAAVVDAAAGPTGMMLLMLGAEDAHFRAMLVALAFQLLVLATLPQFMGPTGAGAAVLASKIVWNAVMLRFIWRRFGIGPLLIRA